MQAMLQRSYGWYVKADYLDFKLFSILLNLYIFVKKSNSKNSPFFHAGWHCVPDFLWAAWEEVIWYWSRLKKKQPQERVIFCKNRTLRAGGVNAESNKASSKWVERLMDYILCTGELSSVCKSGLENSDVKIKRERGYTGRTCNGLLHLFWWCTLRCL